MELDVRTEVRGDRTVVAAQGEIDLTSCETLRRALDAADDAATSGTVVDLTAVSFIDSTGLSVLVDGARHARGSSREFGVVAGGHLRELLRITGLDTVMDVGPTVDSAGGAAPPVSAQQDAPRT